MLENDRTLSQSENSHAADAYLRGAYGLKGPAAVAFAQIAKHFRSDVQVRFDSRLINGKSAADLARANIGTDQVIRIITRGPDAEEALTALERAVMDGLESEADIVEEEEVLENLEGSLDVRHGTPAAPGLAIASAFVWHPPELSVNALSEGYPKERNKFLSALIVARQELQKLMVEAADFEGSLLAPMFAEQLNLLDDSELLESTDVEIRSGLSAMEAFVKVAQKISLPHDVEDRVLNILGGLSSSARMKSLPINPIILIARSIAPSDYALLDPERVAGVVLETDLSQSLALKLLKSRAIPCVSRLGASENPIRSGLPLIIDGDAGIVVVKPDAHAYRVARSLMRSRTERKDRAFSVKVKAKEKEKVKEEKKSRSHEIPIFTAEAVDHSLAAAKIVAELDVPLRSPMVDAKPEISPRRMGATRDMNEVVSIDPEVRSEAKVGGRKRRMWDVFFHRREKES